MKKTGRIFSILTSILILMLMYTHENYMARCYGISSNSIFNCTGFVFTAVILISLFLWWGGKRYDMSVFYSQIDPLTGVYNRRYVYEVASKTFDNAFKRSKLAFLLIIDIDNFKAINDTYGHCNGDLVLQSLAHKLNKMMGKKNVVSRWGGDEFLIIYKDLKYDDKNLIIQKIQDELDNISDSIGFNISASIGAACYPKDGNTLSDLLNKADKNMYSLKKKGNSLL